MGKRKAARRGNKEGSIYYRAATDTFEGKVSLGRNPVTGRLDRRTVTGKTKGEVVDKMNKLRGDSAHGQLTNARGWTFGAYLEHWLKHKAPNIKPTTHHAYKRAIEQLAPLNDYPLAKVGTYEVDCVVRAMLERGVSPGYVRSVLTTLSSAIKQAVRWQLLPRNWAEDVTRPKARPIEQTAWEPDEVNRFIQAASAHRLHALFYVALTTGMRRAELLGLHWSDIKFARDDSWAILHVRRNVVEPEDELIVQDVKTTRSNRRIRVGRDTVEVLRRHKQRQLVEAADRLWENLDIVFASEVGTYVRPRNITRTFTSLVKTAKVPNYGLHGLRRTHASLLIRQGADLKMVSRRLGHYDPSFTMRVYQHVYDDQEEQGAMSLAELTGRTTEAGAASATASAAN